MRGRCAAPSSARSRTSSREKILFGELRPGQIVVVDAEGEGDEETFTFVGEQKEAVPDAAPVSTAAAPE